MNIAGAGPWDGGEGCMAEECKFTQTGVIWFTLILLSLVSLSYPFDLGHEVKHPIHFLRYLEVRTAFPKEC